MNIKVLGIFQWECYPRCCIHCNSVVSLLLGLITSKLSITNHPKVRTKGTFWRSKCSSLQMLQTMNSVVGGKIKSKSKRRSCPNQPVMDVSEIWYCIISCKIS